MVTVTLTVVERAQVLDQADLNSNPGSAPLLRLQISYLPVVCFLIGKKKRS